MALAPNSHPGQTQISGGLNTRGGQDGKRTPVAADFALHANWGTTASVGTIVGSATRFSCVVTSAGTGQGASPTIVYTIPGGAQVDPHGAALTPVVNVWRPTLTNQPTIPFTATWNTTTVTVTFFGGTPVDAETFALCVDIGY